MEFAVQVQIIENRQSRKYLVLIDFNEFSRDCLMLLGIFGFPFADADCDAFLSPVNPLSPACLRCPQSPHWTGQSLVSGSGSAPAAPKHCQSRIRRRPAQALGPHLPHPRRLTQNIYKVFSAKI